MVAEGVESSNTLGSYPHYKLSFDELEDTPRGMYRYPGSLTADRGIMRHKADAGYRYNSTIVLFW